MVGSGSLGIFLMRHGLRVSQLSGLRFWDWQEPSPVEESALTLGSSDDSGRISSSVGLVECIS